MNESIEIRTPEVKEIPTKQPKRKSDKPPTEAQLQARENFKIYARARSNYMKANPDENGKCHRPPKDWKPTEEELLLAKKQLSEQ